MASLLTPGCLSPPWSVDPDEARQATGAAELEVLVFGDLYVVTPTEATIETLCTAWALSEMGDLPGAFEQLDDVEGEHPRSAELHETRGALHALAGFGRLAQHEFQRALELSPGRAETWASLGHLHLELNFPIRALSDLRKARELGLEDFRVLRSMARANRRLGRLEEARQNYVRSLDLQPQERVELLVEAASLPLDGARRPPRAQLERALVDVDAALALDPEHARAWFVRGLLHEPLGDDAIALQAYAKAVEYDRNCREAWTNLALLCHRAGERERCADAAKQALALEEDPARRRALRRLLATRE